MDVNEMTEDTEANILGVPEFEDITKI